MPPNPPEPIQVDEIVEDALDNEDVCAICKTNYEEDGNTYTIPECSHMFHSDCILQWFRSGSNTCPYCRSVPQGDDDRYNISRYDMESRYKFNRAFARRKNAPKNLVSMVKKIKKFETNQRERRRLLREWNQSDEGKEFVRLRKTYRKLRNHSWSQWRRKRQLKSQISNYPIVPAVVPNRSRG